MRIGTLLAILLFGSLTHRVQAQEAGTVLPQPTAGVMDIHHINTGQGNAAFFILPDGTTMVFDCGDCRTIKREPKFKAPARPDDSRSPGEWVSRYIQKFHPAGENGVLDYLVLSHLHTDHIAGVPDLAQRLKIGTVIDRGWPDYQKSESFTGPLADQYKQAIKAQIEQHGTKASQFKVGVSDQIILRNEPQKYPQFEVRNIAANGCISTGSGTEVRQRTPTSQTPKENASSIAMRIRYGAFDYYTGGDLPGVPGGETRNLPLLKARRQHPEWADMESPIAWVVGPVDAMVLNHHGGQDTTNAYFLSVLQPRIAIALVWDSIHVTAEVLKRLRSELIYPGPRDIFTTNGVWEGKKEHMIAFYGEEVALRHYQDLQNVTASHGHIVIRVDPGGDSYRVYVLDDSSESFIIRSVHGPYTSR